MTPEQKLFNDLKSVVTSILPKGRWMLQRIETSTASGIPDIYFSAAVASSQDQSMVGGSSSQQSAGSNFTCWLETKTLDYKVTSQQVNWSAAHGKTHGKTYLITYAPDAPHAQPQRSTNKTHATVPANYPEWLQGRPISSETAQRDAKATTNGPDGRLTGEYYDWERSPVKGQRSKQLVILEFTDTIDNHGTLGAYIKKERPHMEALEGWLKRVTS
jgi:hypothetical protein